MSRCCGEYFFDTTCATANAPVQPVSPPNHVFHYDLLILSSPDKSNYGQFEIPGSWAWANLGIVCNLSNGIAKRKADSGNSTVVLRLADLGDEKINLTSPRYINLSDGEVAQYKLNKGDLVFVRVNGSKQNVGKTFVFDNDTVVAYCDHLMRGRPDNRVDSCYLSYALRSTVCRATIDGLIVTTAGQNTISQGNLSSILIPLPPLLEQHRIVAAINAAFAVIDEIERNKTDLQAAIAAAKRKILSLAIQGKLVPQDPDDEPASALLERMKVKSSVDSSHYPKLPAGWRWVRIKDVCQQQETRRPKGDFFRYIDIDSIDNKRHCVAEPKTISINQAPSRAAKGVCSGDTLFSMVRPYLENIAYIPEALNDCIASTGFYVCRPHKKIVFPRFLFYFLTSSQTIRGKNAYMRGDNSPSIRKDEMDDFLIPIPPFPEQRRIVSAIEEAFEQLNSIVAMLS